MPGRPNFFIVGAPKCGTTALSEYLREHPNVFMSSPKEPSYFSSEISGDRHWVPQSIDEHLGLFADADERHIAIGEASVHYLYSGIALERIRGFNPQARIIAMVRNPIEMAYSLHSQLYYRLQENVQDFRHAWQLQEKRRQGKEIPRTTRIPALLQYKDVCSLGSQIERLLRVFPAQQVEIIVFDDFVSNARTAYEEVLTFLGLPPDGREHFPRVNPNKGFTLRPLAWIDLRMRELARIRRLSRIVLRAKRALGLEGKRLLAIPVEGYTKVFDRPRLEEDFRAELAEVFRPDVEKLSRLLGRDLGHWLESG